MAARRLKFKPKPLVGLVRRNKDLNNASSDVPLKNTDLIDGCNPTSFNKNENNQDSENIAKHGEGSKIDEVSVTQTTNTESSYCHGTNSVQTPVLTFNDPSSINSNVDFSNNNEGQVQSDLRSDINNRIRTVISNSRVSVDSCDSSNDCITNNLVQNDSCNQIVTEDLKESENSESNIISVKHRPPEQCVSSNKNDGGKDDGEASFIVNNAATNQSESSSSVIDSTVINHDKSDTADSLPLCTANRPTVLKNDNENKDPKCGQGIPKIPLRFSKTKFKPVLSNVVRKKDVKTTSKNDETMPEITTVDSKLISCEENSKFSENETSSISRPIEKSLEKENIDKNINAVEESISLPEKDPIVVHEKPLRIVNTNDVAHNKQNDVTPPVEMEVEQPVRSPVKLFQPIKRQRSQGTTYSNLTYKAFQDFKDKFKDGNIDKSKLMMRDLIFYNPKSNPMPERPGMGKLRKEQMKNENSSSNSVIEDKLEEEKVDDICDNDSESSMPVPQVKVGPDGKIILDPRSLVIEATGIQKGRANLEKSEIVQENEFSFTKFNKRRARRSDWSAEETLLFYKALNDLGADFSLMQSLFPKKTRRDLKLKFKKEEKINVHLIDKAMTSPGNFDFAALENELKKDREEREKMLEENRKLREQKKKEQAEKKAINKSLVKRQPKLKNCSGESGSVKSVPDKMSNKNDDKIKRILAFKKQKKDGDDEDEKLGKKKPRVKRLKKVKENGEKTEVKVTNIIENSRISSSDDGIVSDFIEEENEVDVFSDIAALNSQVFKKTRSGRQPKSKLLREDSPVSDDSPRPRKILKKEITKRMKNNNLGYRSLALDNVLGETVREFNENGKDVLVLSEEEIQRMYQKKFERCYKLFEEPLDLSNPNLKNSSVCDYDCNDYSENNSVDEEILQDISIPVIDRGMNSEIICSNFSSVPVINNSPRKELNLSESLQIMEELTSSHNTETSSNADSQDSSLMNYGVYMLPNDKSQYILPGHNCEEIDANSEIGENCSDRLVNDKRIIYSLNDNKIVEQGCENERNVDCRPIIVNDLQVPLTSSACITVNSGQRIQIISQEQINYILRQSCNIVEPEVTQDVSSVNSISKQEDGPEPISHSKIHCYPSSDHTYTSLTPKPVEQNNTYVIVTQMNSADVDDRPRSTIVVYPSSNCEVPP